MPEDKAAVLQRVLEFKRLDRRKTIGALTPGELSRWQVLHAELGQFLMGEAQRALPNRREALRVSTNLQAVYKDADAFQNALITNISGGGLFIQSTTPLPLDTELTIALEIGSGQKLAIKGRVVWVNTGARLGDPRQGIGIKFLGLTPEHRTLIDGYIHKALEAAAEKRAKEQEKPGAKATTHAPKGVRKR